VLAASNVELLIFGGLISLPIALILTIVASRIDRGNRKAQQNQSNSQPPKERFRKLKKVLKWVAIGLTAMLLALIIGFISNL
jgi:ABC-type Fe3+ transport system permease subunit